MVDQVNTTAVVTYESNMRMALQPQGGDLMGLCLEQDLEGELAELDDIFGAADTETIRDRHVPITPTEAPQDRLWLGKPDPDYYDRPVNSQDKLMARVQLTGGYVMQGSAAIRRYWDRQWINGFFGPRQTGKKGTIVVPFPSGQVVPYNTGFGAGGTYRHSVEKCLIAREILGLGNVDYSDTLACMMITPKQETDLLREVQVTSSEFTAMGGRMSKDNKHLVSFLGFEMVKKNLGDPLYANKAPTTGADAGGGTSRRLPFWVKEGVAAGWWERLFTDISVRADLHYEQQVYARSCVGVTRTQDGYSGYIECREG
ncbi:phage capsid protein [Novosphingobium rosa]|uniref:phage capsid protein n=1 Tax=Novosphingobium rosa TaxID=76978 RepID=UPI00082A1447|nr:phage capsid protein [Novosphingobium rosa]